MCADAVCTQDECMMSGNNGLYNGAYKPRDHDVKDAMCMCDRWFNVVALFVFILDMSCKHMSLAVFHLVILILPYL
jgi:hypothetical protein